MTAFQTQLAGLARDAAAHPDRFGDGVRLLFSCRTGDMMRSLAAAQADGLEARGVGRMHVLIELLDIIPDEGWMGADGQRIARYFERIGGIDPQIAVDRGVMD